ncbi:MAG: tRNA (adenosine(37)-N6)-threonylcarbamoyltransferase complex ATPase subunit type 1 TsaE [Sedimentisphaeraceae bacterium JB056]
MKIVSNSVEDTIALGVKIGQKLKGGEVFAINGNLGAGKTHLIKGIVKGVAESDDTNLVCSPTFVLVKEYLDGRLDLYHIDAYRLDTSRDFENLGFDDMCTPGSVVLVEWANRVQDALKGVETINVTIEHTGQSSRDVTIDGLDV